MTRGTNFGNAGRAKRNSSPGVAVGTSDSWYVTFHNPEIASGDYYIRNTQTFRTESEAKQFARARLFDGCNVSAGTLNPHFPKRTIGPSMLEGWLASE